MNASIKCTKTTLLFFVGLAFAVPSTGQAVLPPPDGGYSGGNTAEGQNALLSLTGGTFNTGLGLFSLRSNTTGSFNTATGAAALLTNNGNDNTATGAGALLNNTTGGSNTATGESALFFNTIGRENTADGSQALQSNTTGNRNLASGEAALINNTTGRENTAVGNDALRANTTGVANTAVGRVALQNNTTGIFNTALGLGAGEQLTTGNDNLDIDNAGVAGESGTIRIGDGEFQTRTFIAAIRGVTTGNADALPVVIDSAGQLGTMNSSRRFKRDIEPMDKASEAILALKPVTFRYKSDGKDTPQFGLIAEEVADVNPNLVVRDPKGEIYTVRYDQVNAMLLNEFLKEHKTVQEQQKEIDTLKAELRQQRVLIQKVSTQLAAASQSLGGLEVTKSSPRMVLSDQ
jgi:hypothetical protein